MAFTFSEKQLGQTTTSGTTLSAGALANAVTTSQFVVGAVVWSQTSTNATISSVKDEANNPYTLVGSRIESTASGTYVQLYYLDAPPGNPKTLTVTMSGATGIFAIYVGVFNRGGTVTLDKNSTNTGSGTAISVASFTPSGANELIFSACVSDAGTTFTAGTNGGSYTILEVDNTSLLGASEYLIQTTATPTTANFTAGASSTWAEAAAAFQEASGTVFIPPRRLVKTYDLTANIKH